MTLVGPKRAQSIKVDLRHAILMIARSLDYVGIDDPNHGHRVGYIAFECAKRLGWSESRREFIYFAGLLHDCGVSSTNEHKKLLAQLEPESPEEHCVRGYEYLQSCIVLRPFAAPVRYHHTPWAALAKVSLDNAERDAAALIALADRVDFMRKRFSDDAHPDSVVLHEDQIAAEILENSGSLFCPEFATTMAEIVKVDGFWFKMDQGFIESLAMQMGGKGGYDVPLSVSETINLATFMARIVDAKSPFTYQHSERVALVASELAGDMGYDRDGQQQILVAGLLHDLGKLRVADGVLHKPDKLTEQEYIVIKRHVVDTWLALDSCFPGSRIPLWAANHHEKLDGTGYPNKLAGDEIDLPSRIIAVADIFQALAQNRPYRGRMKLPDILGIMEPQAAAHKLDDTVFAALRRRADHYYTLATD